MIKEGSIVVINTNKVPSSGEEKKHMKGTVGIVDEIQNNKYYVITRRNAYNYWFPMADIDIAMPSEIENAFRKSLGYRKEV